MKSNNIIICDTREKNNKKILQYFDEVNQDYIISKLEAGDYMQFKNYKTIIDKKDGLSEIAGNLCNKQEHERIKREILKAKQLGCTNFIFLIQQDNISTVDDIKNWSSPYKKVKGETLLKIMNTMIKKYQIRFIICPKKDISKKIIQLLNQSEIQRINDERNDKK